MLGVSQATMTQLFHTGKLRAPCEAVGLLVKGGLIIELPNRSTHPHDSFEVRAEDIKLALELRAVEMTPEDWADMILWHTHPAGLVGPSRTDMKNRVRPLRHLVVALTEDGPVPTYY